MEENKPLENQEPEAENTQKNNVQEPIEITVSEKKPALLTQSMLFRFMLVFGIVFMCFIFVFQVWLTPIKVIGSSMQPTINCSIISENDDSKCDIVYYNNEKSYSHDDIVIIDNTDYKYIPLVLKDPDGNILSEQDVNKIIKRVIACPGDSITFYLKNQEPALLPKVFYYDIIVKDKDGNIIDLDNSYLNEDMMFTAAQLREYSEIYPAFGKLFENIENTDLPPEQRQSTIIIPENTYFVMGDNRNNSEDSRFFGVVDYDDIAGSVRFSIPYGKNLFQAIWIKLKSII